MAPLRRSLRGDQPLPRHRVPALQHPLERLPIDDTVQAVPRAPRPPASVPAPRVSRRDRRPSRPPRAHPPAGSFAAPAEIGDNRPGDRRGGATLPADRGHGQLHRRRPRTRRRRPASYGWTSDRAEGPIVWAAGSPQGNLQKCIRRRAGRSYATGADIGRTRVPATPAGDHLGRTRQRRSEASPATSETRSDVQQYEPDGPERRRVGRPRRRSGAGLGASSARLQILATVSPRQRHDRDRRVEFGVAVGVAGVRAQRHGDTCRHRGDPAG